MRRNFEYFIDFFVSNCMWIFSNKSMKYFILLKFLKGNSAQKSNNLPKNTNFGQK